jgi:hypothetical protein
MDSPEHCDQPNHFQRYPYKIDYQYNSRGFRDQEWPADVSDAVWCIGDSFTAGVGVPYSHTWPQILQNKLNRRTINVSLDGASNNWIARQAQMIIDAVKPQLMIIQWSYSHRRELPLKQVLDTIWQEYYLAIKDPNWPDCASADDLDQLSQDIQSAVRSDPRYNDYYSESDLESLRRLQSIPSTAEEDIANTQECIDTVSNTDTKIIHSFIPKWHVGEYRLNFHGASNIAPIEIIDFGRDGRHYDILTAQKFVDQVLSIIDIS